MRGVGASSIDELRAWSVADPAWFWDEVVTDLGIPFSHPYSQVLDASGGVPWGRWFADGHVNVVDACLDRWRDDDVDGHATAIVASTEDGEVRRLSFRQAAQQVDCLAAALRAYGIGPGDAVGVFMPMVPEAVLAMYATAKVGAIYVPIFSGFAAEAVAARLRDAGARLVFSADATTRHGVPASMKVHLDSALAACPNVETAVVLERFPGQPGSICDRDVAWEEFCRAAEPVDGRSAHDTGAEDVFMLAYTSGTTGRPKVPSTSTAASSSRWLAKRPTRRTWGGAAGCCGSPTWAGSWARGAPSGRTPMAPRS
jgi:acetyl-CoA synthetase